MIWPHLSCRLSRVIVAPGLRGRGLGGALVDAAAPRAFGAYHVDRVDLGVAADNAAAAACYLGRRFVHVGTWRRAIRVGDATIDVRWTMPARAARAARRGTGT